MATEVRGGLNLKETKTRLSNFSEDFTNQQVSIIRFSPPKGEVEPDELAKYEAARYSTEHKVKTFSDLGCVVRDLYLDNSISELEFLSLLEKANEQSIAVIVQNPYPGVFKEYLSAISYEKDIDGLREDNPLFPVSATSETIFRIVEPFVQENDVVAVVGAKGFVGRGVTQLLEEAGIKTLALDAGDDLTRVRQANIVVSATGKSNLLDEQHIVPEHRLVVDAGFIPQGGSQKPLGDVNRSAYDIPQNITPVPGGVGPFQMATLMERLVKQVTGQKIQQWDIPNPSKWPIYASAIGRGPVIQDKVKKLVSAYGQGKPLEQRDRIALKKTFNEFKEELASIQDWYSTAQQLGQEPDNIQKIADTEKNFRQGQPLSAAEKLAMRQDKNQLTYNQLSAGISQIDPKAFLVRLVANAASEDIRPPQIEAILSLSPVMQAIQEQTGEQAGQDFTRGVIRDGLNLNKQEQPKRPPPKQQRDQDIDRGPSR